jgi:regulator of replication initiation timing
MSEERFDRLEGQLTQIIQAVGTMQQNMGAMNQNIDALREDVISLRHRLDSVEGSQQIIIREGFQSLQIELGCDSLGLVASKYHNHKRGSRSIAQPAGKATDRKPL